MPKTSITQKYIKAVTNITVIKLRKNPDLPICIIETRSLEKTIALGGVPIGSIKAHDAVMVAGSISKRGLICNALAVAARIGSIIVADAVLEVTSVRNVIVNAMAAIMIKTGTS